MPASKDDELQHLEELRHVLKWCYDHGILKGEFPDSGNDKTEMLNMAERRLEQLIHSREEAARIDELKRMDKRTLGRSVTPENLNNETWQGGFNFARNNFKRYKLDRITALQSQLKENKEETNETAQ